MKAKGYTGKTDKPENTKKIQESYIILTGKRREKKMAKEHKPNPALTFINAPEEEEKKQSNMVYKTEEPKQEEEPKKEEGTPKKKKGYRTVYVDGKPVEIESKSKRLQLLITPTLHTKAKKQAKAEGLSLNELFNKALAEYLEEK